MSTTCCICTRSHEHAREVWGECGPERDPRPIDFALGEDHDLPDRGVQVELLFLRGGFLRQGADPRDHLVGSLAVADDAAEGVAGFLEIRRRRPPASASWRWR